MITSVEEFRERLMQLDPEADEFAIIVDEVVEELSPDIASSVFPIVFEFFESCPDADCGAPGTLVHHTENSYPNYLLALKESVRRRPSFNGVLMINRILNSDVDELERTELMQILRVVVAEQKASDIVTEMAEGFIERQG